MASIAASVRRHPLVVVALLMLGLVLGMLAAGQGAPAQWVASGFVILVIGYTAVDMVRDVLRGTTAWTSSLSWR